HRRTFADDGTVRNSLGDFPEAVRQVAAEEKATLIDLHAMSKTFYEALGPETSRRAFVHYPAGTFPGQQTALRDDTHFNAYGAYQLARCIAKGVQHSGLGLRPQLPPAAPAFDPAHPDPPAGWSLPASPAGTLTVPEGR